MDGAEIKQRREARGLTQQELAAAIGVGMRTVGNWERGASVPQNRMGMLHQFFGVNDALDDPLRSASDMTLLSELMRRAADRAARRSG